MAVMSVRLLPLHAGRRISAVQYILAVLWFFEKVLFLIEKWFGFLAPIDDVLLALFRFAVRLGLLLALIGWLATLLLRIPS